MTYVIEHKDSDPAAPRYCTGKLPPEPIWTEPGDLAAAFKWPERAEAEHLASGIAAGPHRVSEQE